jgi:hypothetical protein
MSNTVIKSFTTTSEWQAPAGVNMIIATGCGGGGGGAGSEDGTANDNEMNWGGGGGSAAIQQTYQIPVIPGNIYLITIGAGGAGGAGGQVGGNGGDTTIQDEEGDYHLRLKGGYGGYHCTTKNQWQGCGSLVWGGQSGNSPITTTAPESDMGNAYELPAGQPLLKTTAYFQDNVSPPNHYTFRLAMPVVNLYAGGFGGCSKAGDGYYTTTCAATAGSKYPGIVTTNSGGAGGTVGTREGTEPNWNWGGGAGGGGAASAYGSGGDGGNGGSVSMGAGADGVAGSAPPASAFGAGGGGAGSGGYGNVSHGSGQAGGAGYHGVLTISWQE